MTLNGKRIVVLGGSSGIGLAVAQSAAREGAAVVIVSSNQARVDQALATLPAGAEGHAADLGDEAAVRALFGKLGAFDHLVFTAGEIVATRHPRGYRRPDRARLLRPALLGRVPGRQIRLAAASARAARSSSPPASPASGPARAGRSAPASAAPWRG